MSSACEIGPGNWPSTGGTQASPNAAAVRGGAKSGMSRPVGSKQYQPGQFCTATGRHRADREAEQPPDEDAEMRDVMPAEEALAGAGVGGVEEFVEGGAALTRAVDVAQVGEAADRGAGQRSDQALGALQLAEVGRLAVAAGPIAGSSPWRRARRGGGRTRPPWRPSR